MIKYILKVSLVCAMCVGLGVSVGCLPEKQTRVRTQNLALGTAERVDTSIRILAGHLNLGHNTPGLLSAGFTYHVPTKKPDITYTEDVGIGQLQVHQKTDQSIGRFTTNKNFNVWDLQLTKTLPMDLKVDVRKGRADLDLTALNLRRFDLIAGQTVCWIDLSGPRSKTLYATISAGSRPITIRLPVDHGVRVSFEGDKNNLQPGALTIDEEGQYVNTAYGDDPHPIIFQIRAGTGSVILQ